MYEYAVQFFPVSTRLGGEIADEFYKQCFSCDKQVAVNCETLQKMPKSMSEGEMYCQFCTRRCMQGRRSFAFSLKAIICQLSDVCSSQQNRQLMHPCQLLDYVEAHKQAGLRNYCLDYDDESLNWFVDLSMVGDSDSQVPERELQKSFVEMLACFNPSIFGIDLQPTFIQIRDRLSERMRSPEQRGGVFYPTFGGMRVPHARVAAFSISDVA